MVANTDIKFYVHTNNNAPQLQNAYGSMINVLDACLVNGINIGGVSSLTASGTTITALFSSAHNLMQYQVIKITGAVQPELNGEHRILTVPNAQSVTFELAAAPSTTTATGTITASLPPLGWEKPFSSSNPNGGGKAAYRSKNLLLPSRPFLRVVDELDPAYTATYAKYAKVGIVEDMTDIDTMLGVQAPFDSLNPDKNWVATGSGTAVINGWAKWYYARTTDWTTSGNFADTAPALNGNRSWLIIGAKDYFYVCPNSIEGSTNRGLYGFGSFNGYDAADNFNNFLLATINYAAASSGYQLAQKTPSTSVTNSNTDMVILNRPYNASLGFIFGNLFTAQRPQTTFYSGVYDYFAKPSMTNNIHCLCPVFICDTVIRGELPILKWLQTARELQDLTIRNIGVNKILFVNQGLSSGLSGQIAFNIG